MRPAWSAAFEPLLRVEVPPPLSITPAWALHGGDGRGVRVGVIDSGIDALHPRVGAVAGGVDVSVDRGRDARPQLVEGPHDDLFGHGTACAGIIRALAPAAELYSIRVLGRQLTGRGVAVAAGLRWALDHGVQVVNLSLSTGRAEYYGLFHELADEAYFRGVMLVCAANNLPGPTYPSQFSSVFSVAAYPGRDPLRFAYNPVPPVEFGAPGIDVEVGWLGGGTIRATGNSFAAPHIAGIVARILSKHPGLTPFQMKTVLVALAENAATGGDAPGAPTLAARPPGAGAPGPGAAR